MNQSIIRMGYYRSIAGGSSCSISNKSNRSLSIGMGRHTAFSNSDDGKGLNRTYSVSFSKNSDHHFSVSNTRLFSASKSKRNYR